MNKREFILNTIADELLIEVDDIGEDDYLVDLGFSSVEMVSLSAKFEDRFGIGLILQDMWDLPISGVIQFAEAEDA